LHCADQRPRWGRDHQRGKGSMVEPDSFSKFWSWTSSPPPCSWQENPFFNADVPKQSSTECIPGLPVDRPRRRDGAAQESIQRVMILLQIPIDWSGHSEHLFEDEGGWRFRRLRTRTTASLQRSLRTASRRVTLQFPPQARRRRRSFCLCESRGVRRCAVQNVILCSGRWPIRTRND
jgi:hypothetical protein